MHQFNPNLSNEQKSVLLDKANEAPFSGALLHINDDGSYVHELWAHESTYKMLPADKAAQVIVNGVEANKLYVYTGTDSGTTNLLYRLAPKFATHLTAKRMKSLLE